MERDYQITKWCHRLIREQVKEGDICVDATAGNGYDTELLCELTGSRGKVYAFDIQEAALQNTRKRLGEKGYQAELILAGHETMRQYVNEAGKVSCIVFNFGYLPGGDHDQATHADTSIQAIIEALELLKSGGIISLCIYSGGDSGFEEREAILNCLAELDHKKFLVIVNQYYNRPNNPPIPALILKL